MSKCEPTENVSVSVPITLLAITDHFCKEADLTRSQAFNRAILDAWVAGDRRAMKEYLRHYRIPPVVNAPIHRGHAERPASAGKPTADRHSRAGRG